MKVKLVQTGLIQNLLIYTTYFLRALIICIYLYANFL